MKLINLNNLMWWDCPTLSLFCCFSNCFQSLDNDFPSKQSSPVHHDTRFPLPQDSSKIITLPLFFSVMTTETFCLPKTNQLPYTQDHPAHYSFPPFSDKRPPNYPSFPSTCPLLPTPEVQAHSVILPEIIIPTLCHQLFLHLSLKWG